MPFPPRPAAQLEQVVTPAEAASDLLLALDRQVGLAGRSVVDLGCGTGRLAIGAALLGAGPVTGLDVDPRVLPLAEAAARAAGVSVKFLRLNVDAWVEGADVFVMNPPFGAQRRFADRPFWEKAFSLGDLAVGAFASSASRTFIARLAVDHGAQVVEVVPVPWNLPRTFPHHRAKSVRLAVDRWVIKPRSKS